MSETLHPSLGIPGSYFWVRTRGTADPKPGQNAMQIDLIGQYEWLDMLCFLHRDRDRLFYPLSAHAMAESTGRDGTGYLVSLADLAAMHSSFVPRRT